MATVDSKGRIVIPQEIRDSQGLILGTEVTIRVEDGTAIVEHETDPELIIERMERLVEETAANRGETTPLDAEERR